VSDDFEIRQVDRCDRWSAYRLNKPDLGGFGEFRDPRAPVIREQTVRMVEFGVDHDGASFRMSIGVLGFGGGQDGTKPVLVHSKPELRIDGYRMHIWRQMTRNQSQAQTALSLLRGSARDRKKARRILKQIGGTP
jgi:hypothetical protein